MTQPFHAGELAVQERAGVRATASRVGRSIHDLIPPVAADFLAARSWLVAAAADQEGRPWASLLAGRPGFVSVPGNTTVRIQARPSADDPLGRALAPGAQLGLLAPDLATRRRMRLNGRVELVDAEGILLSVDQVYANCPQYITPRAAAPDSRHSVTAGDLRDGLRESDRDRIRQADTFFIATINPGEGADASHRGGAPGFMQVEGNTIIWPDYQGNRMFNTLGNIVRLPRAGLLIPDWETGTALQLTGRADIDWDRDHAARVPGAERLVRLEVEQAIEVPGVTGK